MAMQAAPDRREPRHTDEFGQVLQFRGRPGQILTAAPPISPHAPASGADNDFARYEQDQEEPIDDRQRMLMNMIAVAIVIMLIGVGVWIADTISVTAKAQDCAMQGRTNCAPLDASARE
jgi:hypothetical protein